MHATSLYSQQGSYSRKREFTDLFAIFNRVIGNFKRTSRAVAAVKRNRITMTSSDDDI